MRQFTAIVTHDKGVVTKYQDFADRDSAVAHIEKHNGVKVVEGLDGALEYWDVSGDTPVKDTAAEASDATARSMALLRTERNRRLAETDCLMLSDVAPADNAAIIEYRRALRDLPASTDPANPSWPTKP